MSDPRTHLFANNATARLGAALSDVATTLLLATDAGALFPSPGAGEIFVCTVEDVVAGLREIMYCTARSSNTLTVERAQEGTTAVAFSDLTNTVVQNRVTAGTLEHLAESGGGGGATALDDLTDVDLGGEGVAAGSVLTYTGAMWEPQTPAGAGVTPPAIIQLSVSDLTTALIAGANKAYCRSPTSFDITEVRASLLTAGSSNTVVDVNVDGVSLLTTKCTIEAGEKTSMLAAVQPVINTSALFDGVTLLDESEITIDIDTAGAGAAGLIVTLKGMATE